MTTTTTEPELIEGIEPLRKAILRERFGPRGARPVLAAAPDRAGVYRLRSYIGARTLSTGATPGICSTAELYFYLARFAGAKGYEPLRWVADYETFGHFVDALIDQHPLEQSLHLRISQGLGALIGEGDQGAVVPGSIQAWLDVEPYRAWFVDDRVWNGGLLNLAVINFARRAGVRVWRFRMAEDQ